MMNKPRLDEMMDQFDSKYELVIVAAKRARQLTVENAQELHDKHLNPVSVALKEIAAHELDFSEEPASAKAEDESETAAEAEEAKEENAEEAAE